MTVFPTLLCSPNREIPTFSYTFSLEKVPLSGDPPQSPSLGVIRFNYFCCVFRWYGQNINIS